MKIGVISDTHIPHRAKKIPEEVLKIFEEVDIILHSGDLEILEVLEELNNIAPTIAVQGNMDSPEVKKSLPLKVEKKIGNFNIGIIHGNGSPFGIIKRIEKEFKEVDCIVFGHTHRPCNKIMNNILFFNPGSPTDTFFAPYPSVGILEITDKIEGRIFKI